MMKVVCDHQDWMMAAVSHRDAITNSNIKAWDLCLLVKKIDPSNDDHPFPIMKANCHTLIYNTGKDLETKHLVNSFIIDRRCCLISQVMSPNQLEHVVVDLFKLFWSDGNSNNVHPKTVLHSWQSFLGQFEIDGPCFLKNSIIKIQ